MDVISWETAVIEDNFVQEGYIAKREGLHGEVSFRYLPLTPEETDFWERKRDQVVTPEQAQKFRVEVAKMLAERVQGWSVETAKGDPVQVTANAVRHLRVMISDKLYMIVIGYGASDVLPADQDVNQDKVEPLEPLSLEGELGK